MTNEFEQYIKSYLGIVQSDALKEISSLFKLTTVKKRRILPENMKKSNKLNSIQSGLLEFLYQLKKKK